MYIVTDIQHHYDPKKILKDYTKIIRSNFNYNKKNLEKELQNKI